RHGHVVAQGSSATFNLVSVLPRLERAGVNVKVIAAISEELFDRQPEAYRNAVLPPEARQDLMFVMSGTRRMWPLRNVGSLTDDYSLTADQGNVWLTGGTEAAVIAEAHLDPDSIFAGVQRFALERARMVIASAAMGVDMVSSGERRLRARQRRADQRISHPGHGPARPDGAGIHDRSVQGIRDQVARALPPRLRRFGLREDNSL